MPPRSSSSAAAAPQPASGTVDVNFFVLEGSGLDQGDARAGGGLFAQVFAEARDPDGHADPHHRHRRRGPAVRARKRPARLAAAPGARRCPTWPSNPAACNVFFVREITADEGSGLFGISLGIPAALTIPGTISSGVVINVSAHQTAGGFDTRELGQTITHETGHSLGLVPHERAGRVAATTPSRTPPECAGADPLAAEACADGANFMFWSGRDFAVTPGQSYVMLRSPVVR